MDAYETIVPNESALREGGQALLVLRSLAPGRTKYHAQNVIGQVSQHPDESAEWVGLRVRSGVGNLLPGKWYVRVVRRLPQRVPGVPYSNAFEAMQKAWGHLLEN